MEVNTRIYTTRREYGPGLSRQDRETCPEGDRAVRKYQLRFTFGCEIRGNQERSVSDRAWASPSGPTF